MGYDYGYNNQGGGWGGPNYGNYSGPMKGAGGYGSGYGGGNNYNRR